MINATDKSKLENLYRAYGYEIVREHPEVGVFTYKKSRYFGVDIIPYHDDETLKSIVAAIQENYSKAKFAINLRQFESYEATELELYKSFFSFSTTKNRLQKKYNDFVIKQSLNLLGARYEYIESPYELNSQDDQNSPLFDLLPKLITQSKPHLIIIEAAAGYGKTCTSYELLKYLINSETLTTPIFTELSRNRAAKIFRYILLDEIDNEYPTLNSDIVIREIKSGRIPLIIDGFDELLEKVNIDETPTKAFEEIETMLDTIGTLLEGSAKIILTTRKTALFTGVEFDRWLVKWNEIFEITRISLKEPRIKDWIGMDRYKFLSEKEVPIQYIANPVILTFLKNLSFEEFKNQLETPDLLVQQYFEKMLDREKERQNINITVSDQLTIFRNVAQMLLEFDITVESKEFFKELILDQNLKLLENTRNLYSGISRPTIENLVDSLATHALLDRKGRDENRIGFINDFILGTFLGDVISISPDEKIVTFSNYMLELAANAYRVQNLSKRGSLWNKIQIVRHRFSLLSKFLLDIQLRCSLTENFEFLSIQDITFFAIRFDDKEVSKAVFINCTFKNCTFMVNCFKGVSFINCLFSDCSSSDGLFDESDEISTIKCQFKNSHLLTSDWKIIPSSLTLSEIEREILTLLYTISKTKGHHIIQLIRGLNQHTERKIVQAIESLENSKYIEIRGHHIYFNINRLSDIKLIVKGEKA